MDKLNNKGFTLVELMATIVLLSIIVGIAGYSITSIIEKSKEKDYQLLIKEIKNSVELYYQECKFVNNNCVSQVKLGYLVSNGYLTGNSTDDVKKLVHPDSGDDLSDCKIEYKFEHGDMTVEAITGGVCPTTSDYASN